MNRNIEVLTGYGAYQMWEPAKRGNHTRKTMGDKLPAGYVPVKFGKGVSLLVHESRIRAAMVSA